MFPWDMAAWDLLNADCCCYPLPTSAQPLLRDALAGRPPEEGTNDTSTSVLQCWVRIQLCTGQEDQCLHQTTVRALCQSSVRAHILPVLNGCQAGPFQWPQCRVLHRRGGYYSSSLCSDLQKESGLLCQSAVPSIHSPAVIFQFEQNDQ